MPELSVLSEITLNLLRPNSGTVVYAKQYDKLSRTIDVNLISGESAWIIPDGLVMVVMYQKPDGKNGIYDTLEDNTTPAVTKLSDSKVRIVLAEQALSTPGNVLVEICFYSETSKLTTLSFGVSVEKSVSVDEGESAVYINVLTKMIEGLLSATIYPPQIDPNTLNWITWDIERNEYVDTGILARGDVGPRGPMGYYVSDVHIVTGTSEPGTVDEYGVFINTGDQVGSLYVRNGNDGQGAPSQSTPLSDGTASVGSSTSFARADHVHPLNVSSETPSDLGNSASPGTATSYARADHVHKRPTLEDLGIIDAIYPIGSIYTSMVDTDPAQLFGGNWLPIKDRFLLTAGDSYSVGSTGGSPTVTLNIDQIPAHTHNSRSITGYARLRRYGTSGTGNNILLDVDGAFSKQADTWSGSHALLAVNGTNVNNPLIDRLTFNATHTHDSVGGNASHDNMPPYIVVYAWQRVAD